MSIGFKGEAKSKQETSKDENLESAVDDLSSLSDNVEERGSSTRSQSSHSFSTKLVLLIVAVAIILIVVIVSFKRISGEEVKAPEGTAQDLLDTASGSKNNVYDEDGNVIAKDAIDPGITDYYASEANTTTEKVYSASDYIKDLNGIDVSAVYNVQNRAYIQDYVNYETRRAIIDDGMELYWLEVVYNDKKYRVQCPFVYFKDLGEKGICKVEMEVLTLEGGGKIISYMQVMPDTTE